MRIIIDADDLGMSEAVDDAIASCIHDNLVTSVSLLANGPAFEHAVAILKALGDVDVGVHLDLSEFRPLTEVRTMRALLTPEGTFSRASLRVDRGMIPDVVAEWCAQVERVRSAGIVVTHLDSHQHMHLRPVLFPALAEVVARTGIRRVRGMGRLGRGGRFGPVSRVAARVRAAQFRRALAGIGAITTDEHASPTDLFAAGPGVLRGVETLEVLVHPGNPHSPRYAEELGMLGRVRGLGTLVRWGEIGGAHTEAQGHRGRG
jgi:predicted glycoside hydrolase/deacetylase ChbG (UPF0249 family)